MKKIIAISALAGLLAVFSGCKKPDQPPVGSSTHKVYSASELRAIATGTGSTGFNSDVHYIGVVIADELSGNFYKEIYVRDRYNTGAVHLTFKSSACNFFVGDSVRLNLNGYNVGVDPKTLILEIDSVDCDKSLAKFATGAHPAPISINLAVNTYTNYIGDLVMLCGVGFLPADVNQPYADPIMQLSLNRTIQDCGGKQIVVRTSNYAKFAQQKTPSGNGTIIGIATTYNGTNQMAIRTPDEVNMGGTPCQTYHKKDFNDNALTSYGWTQQSVTNPSVQWTVSTFGSATFAKISGFISGATNSENWLISPPVDLSGSSMPILTFQTAAKYAGNTLEVLISTNYTSGSPTSPSVTWYNLNGFNLSLNNGNLAQSNYFWTPSGIIPLSGFKNSNVRIAFKYTSSTSQGASTFEVDDIVIQENPNCF